MRHPSEPAVAADLPDLEAINARRVTYADVKEIEDLNVGVFVNAEQGNVRKDQYAYLKYRLDVTPRTTTAR